MRSVLMISYDFPPSAEVGAQACVQIGRHLPTFGWMPTVLTVRHVVPQAHQREVQWPGSVVATRMLPHPLLLYRKLRSRRSVAGGGEDASTLAGEPGAFGSFGQRWASLLSVPDDRTGWVLPAIVHGLRAVRRYRIEHLFSTAPWWSNLLVGFGLSRLTRLPWTVHFRDPWTEWSGRRSHQIEEKLERHIIRRANRVVCVTDRHTALLRNVYAECPAEKFVTIPNGYDGSVWENLGVRSEADRRSVFRITYTGELYHDRSPLPLFRAIDELIHRGTIQRDLFEVSFFGNCEFAGGRRTTDLARECGISDRVRVHGLVSHETAIRELVASDLLLLLAEGWSLQIPQKTYEYLRAARPILALTGEGALADLLHRAGGADVVDPADHEGIIRVIERLYRCWREGKNPPAPNSTLVASFDRRRLVERFARVFEGSSKEM